MDIKMYIEEKDKQTEEARAQAEEAERWLKKFPDLQVHTSRWQKVRLWSPSVNPIANDVEIHHSCGCCDDSPLYVTPVLVEGDSKVYGTPQISIGEKYAGGFGDMLDGNWKEMLNEKNVSSAVIEKVREYEKENLPTDYYDDEY